MDEIIDSVTENLQEDNEKIKYYKYEGTPLLLAVQMTVSVLALIGMFTFKFIGGKHFEGIRKWYLENINNSLIMSENISKYKEAFNTDIPFFNNENKERVVTTSCINDQNNVEQVPIEISAIISNPVEKGVITSKFGKRCDPLSGKEKIHYGLDLCAEEGTPIFSVMSGVVEKAERSPSFGNLVIIDHGNGIKTLYAHCKELKVSVGERIKRGQNIALMGNTGYYSTGTHLHVEFIINGKKYDPEPFFEDIYV